MRQIKFRAWSNEYKKWVYFEVGVPISKEVAFEYNSITGDWYQFTGLKDKNGKEIYEGDIVRHVKRKWVVVWERFRFRLISGKKHTSLHEPHNDNNHFEVMGNIYENPELLNQD